MKKTLLTYAVLINFFVITGFLSSCSTKKTEEKTTWSVKIADSERTRFPEAWMIENAKQPRWGYTHGCVAKAMLDMFHHTKDSVYYYYSRGYADTLLTAEGRIKSYKFSSYNIDNINAGKILFQFYNDSKDIRYKNAIDTLVLQMEQHPRTQLGGYWHKKIYPNQMWLDGLYMAEPFLAQYAKDFNKPEMFDDIVQQFKWMDQVSYDSETGLFYHGWDESRVQKWADKTTGQSPNFWSRAIGWFALATVDVLDFLPQDHEGREYLIELVNRQAEGIAKWQDNDSGVWYQVTVMGDREGNYLESSSSAMFVAFLYKAVRMGYLDKEYLNVAHKGFEGMIKEFVKQEPDGTYTITNCCSVGGLGGEPIYRDGSFEYYISEPVIENDPKSVAPFIWAAIENERSR
ncbi:MAG: glycoside hydrolase family 88 protein [Bacteroidales bacterium]|nr:glycoside hydrolase family 88 protein [Bacteroidales bacterium]